MFEETHDAMTPPLESPSLAPPPNEHESSKASPSSDDPASYPPKPDTSKWNKGHVFGWRLDENPEVQKRVSQLDDVVDVETVRFLVAKNMWKEAVGDTAFQHLHNIYCFPPQYEPTGDDIVDLRNCIDVLSICHDGERFYNLRPTQDEFDRLQQKFQPDPQGAAAAWYRAAFCDDAMMETLWTALPCCKHDKRHQELIATLSGKSSD